ncbi:MAG: hypothetical protein AAGG44_04730 [Planctomycetota bacterium]
MILFPTPYSVATANNTKSDPQSKTNRLASLSLCLLIAASVLGTNSITVAAEPASEATPEQKVLFGKFEKLLTGAKLRGQFTVDGRPMSKLTDETYEIEKVEKQPEGDYWVITARIKYGDNDRVFPCPVEVKWAGKTPVITLDEMTIPGMGTFGARVVFHKDKYAGTWQHDEVGGHMFGMIEFSKKKDEAASDSPAK